MSEKLYKPILKDGDHLVRSSQNPDRVRGQSRDINNKNPDIVEWEEVVIEDQDNYDDQPMNYETRQVQLSPEEERLAAQIGTALAAGTIWLFENKVVPWWKGSVWPWFRGKAHNVALIIRDKKKNKTERMTETEDCRALRSNLTYMETMSVQIDKAFEPFRIDMNEKEAKQHIMKILFHMLEIANEIRILSNAQIRCECENEEQYLNRVNVSEQFLTERVAININRLLSDDKLAFDIETSRELFGLMGGGVKLNGEYIPVEIPKVYEAILVQNGKVNALETNKQR